MCIEDYILEAVERAIAWELPSEALAQVIRDQAALMAGISPEQAHTSHLD